MELGGGCWNPTFIISFFFFLMGKQMACINHKKENNQGHQKVYWEFTSRSRKKGAKLLKKNPPAQKNHPYPNHVKKSSKDMSVLPLSYLLMIGRWKM